MRGGYWGDSVRAGVFAFDFRDARFRSFPHVGVRAALFFMLINLGIGRNCRCAVVAGMISLAPACLRLLLTAGTLTVYVLSASAPLFSLPTLGDKHLQRLPLRGGGWLDFVGAGVFAFTVKCARFHSVAEVGVRAALLSAGFRG